MNRSNPLPSGRCVGGIFLVAGTTIGAGMLALPLMAGMIGIGYSIIFLLGMWWLMYQSALVTIELNHFFPEPQSLPVIAKKIWGNIGGIAVSVVFYALFYSLLVAYITGATSIIRSAIPFDHPHLGAICSIIVTVILGGMIVLRIEWLDLANRFFFFIKIIAFGGLIIALAPFLTEVPQFFPDPLPSHWAQVIPIFFTAFGFHGSIPSIIKYVSRNHQRSTFFWGSFIPFIFYGIWIAITLAPFQKKIMDISQSTGGDLGLFIKNLARLIDFPLFETLASVFALMAIFTSFLGVGIALYHLIQEHLPSKSKLNHIGLTFLLPLLFVLINPDSFLAALSYAGLALGLLAIIFPALLNLTMRGQQSIEFLLKRQSVTILLMIGLILIGIELVRVH